MTGISAGTMATDRPRPGGRWAWLIVLPAVALLAGLGAWQLDRLAWKQGLITRLEQRTVMEPVPLPSEVADAEALEFRPLRVVGHYLHDRELRVVARTREGVVGEHLVTPFRLTDGRTLLIDRGWLPHEAVDPAARPESLLEGEVAQVGLARLGGWHGSAWFRPTNDPGANRWLWFDLAAMAEAAGLERPITDLYLSALPEQHPGAWPEGGRTRVALPNDHLQYAVTWFGLAAVLLVLFVLWRRRG